MQQALFGKKKSPQEMSKEWIKNLRHEQRQVERQIRKAERENQKLKNEMKKEAKNAQGDTKRLAAVKILAKAVVQQNKQIAHLYGVKTQMNSVCLHIKEQQANIKMAKSMQQSAKVTAIMGRLVKLPELQKTTMQMSMQMEKAGLINEMIDEAFDDIDPDMEDEVDAAVDAVIMDVTNMNLGQIGAIKNKNLGVEEKVDETDDNPEIDAMKARLKALS